MNKNCQVLLKILCTAFATTSPHPSQFPTPSKSSKYLTKTMLFWNEGMRKQGMMLHIKTKTNICRKNIFYWKKICKGERETKISLTI